jgi:hypothetical protein
MLLDISSYGLSDALKKSVKVLGYHLFSAATVAAFAVLAEDLGKLKIAHPLYAIYLASAIAAVNVVAVFVSKWLSSINPESSPAAASSQYATTSQG